MGNTMGAAAPRPGSFGYIDRQIRACESSKAVGDAFESVCRFFLENAPKYRGQLRRVWLWNEWPGRWGADKGIDLVAKTRDGKLWAIQAKATSPARTILKRELDSFLSESNRPDFDYRLIIATTNDIGRNAMVNRYRREYFRTADKKVRITIDRDLRFYQVDRPRPQNNASYVDSAVIMEIKYDHRAVNEGVDVSSRFSIPLCKNSKYVYGMERLLGGL